MKETLTRRIRVYGIVQGVGFRPTVSRHATSSIFIFKIAARFGDCSRIMVTNLSTCASGACAKIST